PTWPPITPRQVEAGISESAVTSRPVSGSWGVTAPTNRSGPPRRARALLGGRAGTAASPGLPGARSLGENQGIGPGLPVAHAGANPVQVHRDHQEQPRRVVPHHARDLAVDGPALLRVERL